MSSNPHNQKLTHFYSKIAKKVLNSNNNNKTKKINTLNIKNIVNANQTLDNFLSLSTHNNVNNISNSNNKSNDNDTKSKNLSIKKHFSEYNNYLNKKRNYMTKVDEEFELEIEASIKIDKLIAERREKRLILEQQKKEKSEKKIEEKKKKKIDKKINKKNLFLEALGITEEEMQKKTDELKLKEIDKNDKEENLKNILNKNSLKDLKINISSTIIKESLPKYYNFKISREDIYKKVLNFDFYKSKSKTEIVPNYFENELHYRFIWITNFLNELKYYLLNEKAEKSDVQNYKEINIKIKLTYLSQEFSNIANLKITPNKNLNVFKKKILKDNDIIAIYSENEKINFEDISISNKNNLNYFLGIIKRELDSYEIKILIHSNDIEKYNLNYNNFNSKNMKEQFFKIKYLNNINSSIREFNALLYLELSNFKDILNPNKFLLRNTNNINQNENNNKIGSKFQIFLNNIKTSEIYNSSQLEVLIKAKNMGNNDILLVQGPPGTGKTHTILGLLSLFMLKKNEKVLICTQSNTAIDEICNRLINKGILDENLKRKEADFIRFGYFERRDKEKKYLDTKQGKLLEKKSLDYLVDCKFKEKLENSNEEIEKIIKEINQLSSDKEKYKEQIQILENKKQLILLSLNKNKFERQNYEYFLLSNIPILCTTLNNAGNEKLKKTNINYDILIVDEACQCIEPSSLIPLYHGIKKLILVGDHKQLPATSFYPKSKDILYNRSLFERLIDNNIPRHILTIQFRMQTNIRKFISSLFYDNKLIDSPDKNYIDKINNNQLYKIIDINKNFSYFDLNFSNENFDENLKSYYNNDEIIFTFELILKINKKLKYYGYKNEYKYAVITPYQAQVKIFKEEKYKNIDLNNINIEINTVDSFQGQERDIVLFSTVRSNDKNKILNVEKNKESIGFLKDFRRMNVALSRAKLGCFVIGNSQKFITDSYWEKLINFCKNQKCFYHIDSINNIKLIIDNFIKQ